MWRMIFVILFFSFTLVACNNNEEATDTGDNNDQYEPLQYGADEGIERRGQIPTGKDSYFKRTAEEEFRNSRYGQTNQSHDNAFNNEDAMDIMEKVNELDEITMTQAFTTDDKAYIAVMINPYNNRDHTISERVRAKAQEVTDKKVVIWTNNNNWDNMKDVNARLKASKAPDEIRDRIVHFFQRD
ncbi:YhcN/YlaJ family sporulation lipoprotein [Halobacillus locisalis]|uniref:YhcN/YlaJ family sporulation lipoprotein n=1 Tax=Halobacillus locisalis TaxID=220753 RepID=A0A838CNQ2_9BACI|nr:YhcN/YlaJ family sporulation lipoprotein [Halobacillus locisalis]MBA2173469.1 YhcN/YlaJ family sporulation lipoprotein [Halobacillus locisalis]